MTMLEHVPDVPGLWPDFRRDARMSGVQPLPGAIRRPRIAAQFDLGGPIFDAHVVELAEGKGIIVLYGGCLVCHAPDGCLLWKSEPFGVEGIIGIADVDNDGRLEIISANGKSVFAHSAVTGERLWHEYLGPPFAGGFIFTCALLHHFPHVGAGMQLAIGLLSSKEVVVYDFTPGASRPERLHILWMDDFFHPTVLAADVDGDGIEELIVTKFSAVYVFDPRTGALKSQCRWSSGGTPKRNYGLFEVRDLDNDGALDLVILSYVVSRHIAVVQNDGAGNLSNRWDHFIEHVYPHDERELRYSFNSVIDIDGDGRLEAVVSTYNEEGDGRWWLEIFDAWSGERRVRLPDLYLHGIQPAADGGPPVVLASHESTRYPQEMSRLAVLRWSADGLGVEWEQERGAFVGRFCRSSARRTVFRSELPPTDEVWLAPVDGEPSLFVRCEDDSIARLVHDEGGWLLREIPNSSGVAAILAVEDLDGDGRTEVLVSDFTGGLRALDAAGAEHMRARTGMRYRYGASLYFTARPMQTPTVIEQGGARYCIVPDGGTRVHVLRWEPAASGFVEVWCGEGRGRVGPEEAHHNVPVIMYDGAAAMLLARVGDGAARLRALALDGTEMHGWNVPHLPASPRLPRGRAGIHEYSLIATDNAPLVAVSGFRSGSMNSELTTVLEAAGGSALWERVVVGEESEEGRGFGPFHAWSVVGDRAHPQLLFLAKDTFCQVSAMSGTLLHPQWQLRPYNTAHLAGRGMSMDDFSAYGVPVAIDVDGDGRDEWLLQANYGGFGVIEPDHTVRWWLSAPLSSVTSAFAGVADIDGDGIVEIGASYADGDFVCLRADTGQEKWRLHLGQVASDVIVCDIDGDGRLEFILATREGELIALGASRTGCGLIKWRLAFGFGLGPPVAADIDGDGRSEILVVAGDGTLCVIDD